MNLPQYDRMRLSCGSWQSLLFCALLLPFLGRDLALICTVFPFLYGALLWRLTGGCHAMSLQISSIQEQMVQRAETISASEHQQQALQSEISKLTSAVEEQAAQSAAESADLGHRHHAALQQLQSAHDQMQTELKSTQVSLQAAEEQASEAHKSASSLQQQQQDDAQQLQAQLADAQSKCSTVENALEDSQRQHVDVRQQLEAQLADAQAKLTSAESTVQTLQQQYADALEAQQTSQEYLGSQHAAELETVRESEQALVRRVEAQLAEVKVERGTHQAEAESCLRQLQQTQQAVDHANAQIASLQQDYEKLLQQAEKADAEALHLRQELEEAQASHAEEALSLQEQLDQQSTSASSSHDLEALEKRLADQSSKHQRKMQSVIQRHTDEVKALKTAAASGSSQAPASAGLDEPVTKSSSAPEGISGASDPQGLHDGQPDLVQHLQKQLDTTTQDLEARSRLLEMAIEAQEGLKQECFQLESHLREQETALSGQVKAVQLQLDESQAARMQVHSSRDPCHRCCPC